MLTQVDDLDGDMHYKVLGISVKATTAEVKLAYRGAIRKAHPDKGGSDELFNKVQTAFEVLSDPKKREVYDAWAKELQYRYIPGVASKAEGGEDKLLDEFEGLGLHCDPNTQLVVTCEVCRRPSTKECWTCGMKICDFCTLKTHWKGSVGLHWPLINCDTMRDNIGKKQMEQKKLEDAKRHALEDPNFRSEKDLQVIRDFKVASAKMLSRADRLVSFDMSLAQFYMWAQSAEHAFVVCHIPTGYRDKEVVVDFSQQVLVIQPEESPPLIQRLLAHPVDTTRPVETFKSQDHRFMTLCIPKAVPGEWKHLFEGDPDGARCLQPPYELTELEDEVVIELELPYFVEPEDVAVHIDGHGVAVKCSSAGCNLKRTYWRDSAEEKRQTGYEVVDVPACDWYLEDDTNAAGERCKMLNLSLVKPPISETDVLYKKGKRSDNRRKQREGDMTCHGYRFFVEDEDMYCLEDTLQAMCFLHNGSTYVPEKPWVGGHQGRTVTDVQLLSADVQTLIGRLLDGHEAADGEEGEEGEGGVPT
eukprot:jgi/Tetstr1/443272/TSEL_031306.t1